MIKTQRHITWLHTILSLYARGDDPAKLGQPCNWYQWIGPEAMYTVVAQCRVPELFDFFLAEKNKQLVLFIFQPDSYHGRAARILETEL